MTCPECSEDFSILDYVCELCDEQFCSEICLENHLDRLPPCSVCIDLKEGKNATINNK